jgi:hypothetical protein
MGQRTRTSSVCNAFKTRSHVLFAMPHTVFSSTTAKSIALVASWTTPSETRRWSVTIYTATFYPPRSVTLTSADPLYITPTVKGMLRRKNYSVRKGRTEKTAALASKISVAIKSYNSAELCKVDVLSDSRSVWDKVRTLTERAQSSTTANHNAEITASILNKHYAAISSDAGYTAPCVKSTANNHSANTLILERRIFENLDTLQHTATGSTTYALIHLFHTISTLLESNP